MALERKLEKRYLLLAGGDMEQMMDDTAKDIVERALALLMALTGSRSGALFACGRGGPTLMSGHHIDQVALNRVHTAWVYSRDKLQCGEASDGENGGTVIPLLDDRELIALVYIEDRGNASVQEVEAVCRLIRNRLTESPEVPLVPVRDEREHLVLLLERNDWNIARVARLLNVSRLTLYRRLGRFGVARPNGPKRAPAPAASK